MIPPILNCGEGGGDSGNTSEVLRFWISEKWNRRSGAGADIIYQRLNFDNYV